MLTSNNLLLPALIFAVVGFLIGILVMSVFSDRSKRKEKAPKVEPETEDPVLPPTPVLPETRFESIAHIYREKTSGKIVTDVKGKVHLTHNTIPPEQLGGLKEASRNWQNWLGLFEPAPALTPRPAEPAAPAAEGAAPPAAVSPAADPAAAAQAAPVPPPPAAEPQVRPIAPPPTAAAPRPAPVEKPRPKTMVGQIEEILQEMIPQSQYAGQEIHLTEDPTNGVIVWVGALKFTGINNVTDEGVKGLIQAAVRRWEDSGGAI